MAEFHPLFDDVATLTLPPVIAPVKGVSGHTQLGDHQLCVQFLVTYSHIPETFKSYRREVERLCHWSWRIKKASITTLSGEDISSFIEFCKEPPQSWVGTVNARRFVKGGVDDPPRIPNKKWKPFVVKGGAKNQIPDNHRLSSNSLQAIFSILSTFYNFLLHKDLVTHNPVSQVKQKSALISKNQHDDVPRLSMFQWREMMVTADSMDATSSMPGRTRYILALMFGCYPRISELVPSYRGEPKMSDFHRTGEMWCLRLTGKRNKVRKVPVSEALMDEVVRFRESLGLSSHPRPGEQTPLVPALRGRAGITSTRQIRKIIDDCMHQTASRLSLSGLQADADNLLAATVHWIRHTGISEDVMIRPLHHVKEDAGHEDISTTGIYMNPQNKERYDSAFKKKIE